MKVQMLMPLILFSGCKTETTEVIYNLEGECWEEATLEVPWFYWGPYIDHNNAQDTCEGDEYIEYTPLSTCISLTYSCGYRDLYNDPNVVPCSESNLSCCHLVNEPFDSCEQADLPAEE